MARRSHARRLCPHTTERSIGCPDPEPGARRNGQMSANATTAMHGQSSHVGPLGAAAVLTAVVAVGALGFAIGQGVASTTSATRPAAGPVIDSTSMSGPRTAAQRGLAGQPGRHRFRWDRHRRAVSAVAPDPGPGRRFRLPGSVHAPRGRAGRELQRHGLRRPVRGVAQGPGRSRGVGRCRSLQRDADFAGQYEQWLKAQAAASERSFPDFFQRHAAPALSGSGGRGLRLPQ